MPSNTSRTMRCISVEGMIRLGLVAFRYRVETARMKRMAAQDARQRHRAATPAAVRPQSIQGVTRASGMESAVVAEQRAHE